MPTIELPNELYKKLEGLIVGFNDTPASVIERLIEGHRENEIAHRNRITEKEAEEIYSVTMDIYKGRKKLEDGVEYLVKEVGMNESSALIYIKCFMAMKEGALYRNKMTANSNAVRYFLNRTFSDDDKSGLETALDSLWKHIKYRRSEGLKDRGYPKVYLEFSQKIKPKVCPECARIFGGKGWEGMDEHWKKNHANIMPYKEFRTFIIKR